MGLALVAVYYGLLAATRRVDTDEGFYLYAARLVADGETPYLDFFYPQTPLLPYLWARFAAIAGGVSWVSGRGLAALVAWSGALLFLHLTRLRGARPVCAAAILALYLTSDMGLEWAVTVKTYGPATLFLLASCWLSGVLHPAPAPPARFFHFPIRVPRSALRIARLFGCGLLLGAALLCRLTVAPVIVLVVVFVFRKVALSNPRGSPALLGAVVALLLGLLPSALVLGAFWRADPVAFVYGNWTYHTLGGPLPLMDRLRLNLPALVERLLLNPLWLGCFVVAAWSRAHGGRRWNDSDWFCALAFVVMTLASVLPIRSFRQYYCMATPWLLLLAAPAAQAYCDRIYIPLLRRRAVGACAGLGALCLLMAVGPYRALERRWPTWTWRPRTPEAKVEYDHRLDVARTIARRIEEVAPAGSRLLTWWPGYALEVHLPLVEGMENHFGRRIARHESDDRARRMGVLPQSDLRALIARARVEVVVTGLWTGIESGVGAHAIESALIEAGYRCVERVGTAGIYLAPGLSGSST